jgi:hypothetical protein
MIERTAGEGVGVTEQTGFAPLAVYDAQDHTWRGLTTEQRDQLRLWALAQGIAPPDTYRWEIYVVDCPFMRVYEFERDQRGVVRLNDAGTDVLRRPPYDVVITSMPPVEPARREDARR